jgi:hypothetical protein
MSGKPNARLENALSRQLTQLKKYGELLDVQQEMIERSDYEGLQRVLVQKEKVLARLGPPEHIKTLAGEAEQSAGRERRHTEELFGKLVSELDIFSAREGASMERTSGAMAELAEKIYTLRKGKRMLRKYSHAPQAGKARFKDVTG